MGEMAHRRMGIRRRRGIKIMSQKGSERMKITDIYNVMKPIRHFRDLDVYQGAMSLSLDIFEITKGFPVEERYALTDQIRRSCRSICANLAEAWRKRRYPAAFVSKLNDAETEAGETQVHVEFSFRHNYIEQTTFEALDDACDKIIAQIVMIDQSEKWIIKAAPKHRSPRQ
jgi:four helix bundle protein